MKSNKYCLLVLMLLGFASSHAQDATKENLKEPTKLNLKDAIELAITKSSEAVLSNTKVTTKSLEVAAVKNNRYPDVKVSGQYMRLTNASVNLKLNSNNGNTGGGPSNVNQLLLGQANVSMPLFSGFKLQNSIKASENLQLAEVASSKNTKEEIALKVVENYANLYRAQKAVSLIQENKKSAKQRVTDFTNLEKNGVIARNDLLKAQLQQAKVQLSLDEAYKNVAVLNFALTTLLQLPVDYKIGIDEHQFDNSIPINVMNAEKDALENRKDLEALHYVQKANENQVKVAKSNYLPSLALVGGYTTLNLQNVVTVENAMNIGLGVNYNLSSLFKNGKEVKMAKSKAQETEQATAIAEENIKIQVQSAIENYNLALKQNLVYEQAITQAAENYRIVKDKNDNGLATTTELLDADVEQLNSKINYAYSRANIMLKYYEMLAASGQLTSSFNFTKN